TVCRSRPEATTSGEEARWAPSKKQNGRQEERYPGDCLVLPDQPVGQVCNLPASGRFPWFPGSLVVSLVPWFPNSVWEPACPGCQTLFGNPLAETLFRVVERTQW